MPSTIKPNLARQAHLFLASNGIGWQRNETAVPVRSTDGTVRWESEKSYLLGIYTENGFDPLMGVVIGSKPDGKAAYATLPIQFTKAGSIAAAQELLIGDYDALFTQSGAPVILDWDADFQQQLLDLPQGEFDSRKLRSILSEAIATSKI